MAYDKTSIENLTGGYGVRSRNNKMCQIEVQWLLCAIYLYLLLLTTLEVSALFLSLGRHCLRQFFVAVSWP